MTQVQELLRQYSDEIRSQVIREPIIVVGLPRSGTSAITNLLAQHDKLQYVLHSAELTQLIGVALWL